MMRFEARVLKPYAEPVSPDFESGTGKDEAIFETGMEKHMFEYEHALDVLMSCALRRRKALGQA